METWSVVAIESSTGSGFYLANNRIESLRMTQEIRWAFWREAALSARPALDWQGRKRAQNRRRHAADRTNSSWRSQPAIGFQLALFWSTKPSFPVWIPRK